MTITLKNTRMLSSRMCTVCSSSCLLGVSSSVHDGIHTTQVLAWTLPGHTPNLPPGYGPGNPLQPGQTPHLPPLVWVWRPLLWKNDRPMSKHNLCKLRLWTVMRNEYVMCVVVCLTTPVAWIGIGTDIWTRNLCVKTVKALYCKNVSLHIQKQ